MKNLEKELEKVTQDRLNQMHVKFHEAAEDCELAPVQALWGILIGEFTQAISECGEDEAKQIMDAVYSLAFKIAVMGMKERRELN